MKMCGIAVGSCYDLVLGV